MFRARIWASIVLGSLLVLPAYSKKAPVISQTELAQITERGRLLYAYDQAAWHATDAVQATNPQKEEVDHFIAHQTDKGWEVAFGHLNEARDAFLVAYLATQGKTLQEFSVEHLVPPKQDTGFYLVAAKAIDLALRDFHGEKRPYNVAVLPASTGQLYVYVLPAQTENGKYPLGGDARYSISSDGNTIVENRRLHNDILIFDTRSTNGSKPQAGWHTHVLTDAPEDTDVFYVLTRRPSIPEYIGTKDKTIYVVKEDGTILIGK
jgi:hypothetical protein